MNMPAAEDEDNLRYAEYVLGVLDAGSRAAVGREIESQAEAAAEAARWEGRLGPLAEEVPEVTPAPYVWTRIVETLRWDGAANTEPRRGIWDNLAWWRWLGIGASIATAALLLILALPTRHAGPPAVVSTGYMASTIQQENGLTGWTATMDLDHARMVVVPATPAAPAQGQAHELWLIPKGGKPIAVGMIASDKPVTLTLDPNLLARLGPTAALAVSIEPTGGSPTGQPTGPVVAQGAIRGA